MKSSSRERKIYSVTLLGSLVNVLLLLAKFVAGIVGNSAAMIADAVHSLSDFLTDIVVMVFVRISSMPEDEDHDYGHGKYETVATSIIGLVLLYVGAVIGWKGLCKIWDFAHGAQIQQPGVIALAAAIISVLSKEWIFRLTRKVAKDVDSQALYANAWHHRSDALSSIGTAVGIGAAVLFGRKWVVFDPVAAVVVSVFIVITALKIIGESYGELLEKSLSAQTEDRIREIVLSEDGVSDIHHLRTRKLGNRIAIEMHLRMPGETSLEIAHRHASSIESRLRAEFGRNTHIMIHLEPVK